MGLDARHESSGQGRVEHSQRDWPLGGSKEVAGARSCRAGRLRDGLRILSR